jgi:hypothetical protein
MWLKKKSRTKTVHCFERDGGGSASSNNDRLRDTPLPNQPLKDANVPGCDSRTTDYGLELCEADPCARHDVTPTIMVDPGYAMRRDDKPRPDSSDVAPFWILSHEAISVQCAVSEQEV